MKSNLAKKQLTMVTLVLALALAVYLNWRFAKTDQTLVATGLVTGETEIASNTEEEQAVDNERYYGEALFVSSDGIDISSYFAEAQLARSTSRDEALDTLQKALQQANLTQAEKDKITAQMAAVAGNITVESNIESLVKAKGFINCVCYINGDNVRIVVASGANGLTVSEVSQIKEIVLSECEVPVQNITIVEIK